jgi:capsular polysaccharide biosynthesis protein
MGKLTWCLRHYAWVVLACVLAAAAAPLLVYKVTTTYEAQALVVATQLTMNQAALPQMATSVFDDGAVAARVATDPAIGGDTSDLIPDRLSVVAAQDSITLVVQARDEDPAAAARIADLAAGAFVDELNRGGPGVGVFEVQAQASVPTEPVSALSPLLLAALGAAAGLVLGLGLVALIVTVRRPVVTAGDVEAAVGVPLLGTVRLPHTMRRGYPGPLGVRGLAPVVRWLAATPPGRLVLISSRSAVGVRHRIYVMVAIALSTLRPVRLEAPEELIDAVRRHGNEDSTAWRDGLAPEHPGGLVFVDGGSSLEIIDPARTSVSVAAVAPRGVSRQRLRALAADFVDAGLVGIVLVRVPPSYRAAVARQARATSSAPVRTAHLPRPADVPEPGRA